MSRKAFVSGLQTFGIGLGIMLILEVSRSLASLPTEATGFDVLEFLRGVGLALGIGAGKFGLVFWGARTPPTP